MQATATNYAAESRRTRLVRKLVRMFRRKKTHSQNPKGDHHTHQPKVIPTQQLETRDANKKLHEDDERHVSDLISEGPASTAEVSEDADECDWDEFQDCIDSSSIFWASDYTAPPVSSLPCAHWCECTDAFTLRSETYLSDKKKEKCSLDPRFELVGVDLLKVDEPLSNALTTLPNGFGQRFLDNPSNKDRFLFTVHFQLPGDQKLAFIQYFASRPDALSEDTQFSRLFWAFADGSDAFRQSRFKFIPRVFQGPYVVRSMVGCTPAILGNKLTQTYYRAERYLEVCVDVGSSSVGGGLLKLVKGYLPCLSFDMCFVLEAQTEEELPEVSLATIRFSRVDLSMAVTPSPS